MAVAKMNKINIVGRLEEREKIMEAVQDMGVMQVQEHEDEELEKADITEKLNDVEYKLAGVKFSLSFLADYDTEKKTWAEKFNLKKIELTPEELEEKVKNFDYKLFKRVQEVQGRMNEANNIIEKTTEEIKQLSSWKNLDFIPSSENFPEKMSFRLLSFSPSVLEELQERLRKEMPLSELRVVEEGKKEVKASLVYHTEASEKLSGISEDLNIKTEEIPEIDAPVPEYIKRLEEEIKKQREVLEEEKKKAEELATNIKELKILYDHLTWKKERLLAQQKTLNGWKFFSVVGWIESDKIRELKKRISAVTNNFFLREVEPEEGERAPIVFKNSSWARPFEFITGIYGPPRNGDPDPTPFLTPFFVVFFGLCLTDAGYGIILALLAWLGIKFIKPGREAKKMFLVLMYGGLATFFAGALVGGWFGIVLEGGGWFKESLAKMKVIDPVEDPITMLLLSLGLGVVQIFAGIIINIWWKIKKGEVMSALLDDGMWFYFLTVILIWGADNIGMIDLAWAKYLVWIGVAGIVATQGRKAENPALKLVHGVVSLYGVVGYLSDVLSYSRLLALGLATSIIAMVVNLIASLTVDMIPYLGYVIAAVVIIGGHIFNIAINALGSFIHSSRLQFVEFFPKFMESGGLSMTPVKKESKYIKIV